MTLNRLDNYVGRFAPTPSGPLHFGSLVAALASYLDARHHDGLWLLRIEDLDPPRESKEAPAQIMAALEAFGLHWDGPVLYQSQRLFAYEEALNKLINEGLVFPCTCSRKSTPRIYPGTCRSHTFASTDQPYAVKARVSNDTVSLRDNIMGYQEFHPATDFGDFIVKRKDGLFAYQLAVVVDDDFQGITHIVRGSDLLDSTPRQIVLQQYLGFPQPDYAHIPVITDEQGLKLSKQSFAEAISYEDPIRLLRLALQALGQPQPEVNLDSLDKFLGQAALNWNGKKIPDSATIRQASLSSARLL